MTDRQQQAPDAVLRAPRPAAEPVAAPNEARSDSAAQRPAKTTPVPAAGRQESSQREVIQGRRAEVNTATAPASASAAATSPIARRREAAQRSSRELAEQQAIAAAAKKAAPPADPQDDQRVIEPPVEIRQRRFGTVHAGQVMAAEGAIVAVAAVSRSSMVTLLSVAAVSLIALAICFVRIDGRWLYEWLGTALRYLARRRVTALEPASPGSAIVSAVAHGGALRSLDVDGRGVAVLTDSTGFTAVLEVVPSDRADLSSERSLPSLAELLPHNEAGDVPISVQLITHVVPAPNVAALDDAAANSYRELSGGTIPARRRTWVCVQAMFSADVPSPATVEQSLLNAVRRVERRMRKAGFRPRTRTVREAAEDLATLIRMDPTQPTGTLRESWRQWQADTAMHVTYGVREWPALSERETASALIEGIESVPALASTTSLAGRRVGDCVDVEAVIRFTVREDSTQEAVDGGLQRVLGQSGADLRRLDGAHRFGVGATLPTGGFAV
ncbi:type VII secretion protein EccE [Cumulibacter soli]|uniref:type VII secretion protein EccE n=1 Tax=Cumulibacter soli TaxID=2546344 RepID=UPI001068BF11|nr:type VII secretion protein EccE [Cumulibacter soli]